MKINETSTASGQGKGDVDDGCGIFFKHNDAYKRDMEIFAKRIGMEVVHYLLGKNMSLNPTHEYNSVSSFPKGIPGTYDIGQRAGEKHLKGEDAFEDWLEKVKKYVKGMDIINLLDAEKSIQSSKNEPTTKPKS